MSRIYNILKLQGRKMEGRNIEIALVLLIMVLLIFLYLENNCITFTNITIDSDRLPDSFQGYTIVHLADLHNKGFGKAQEGLISKIGRVKPDLIVFTGDLVDSRRYGVENSIKLMERAVKIAPIYYVTGNHEWRSGRLDSLEKLLTDSGVKILKNTHDTIEIGRDKIYLMGIDDPLSEHGGAWHREGVITKAAIEKAIEGIPEGKEFKILLSHRPEKLPIYSQYDIDIVFSGHAHGGQVRLPLIGGIIAPNQGFFPKYTSGKYRHGDSIMVVSRGLGNSIIPQRLFNRPEIVVVKLKKKI